MLTECHVALVCASMNRTAGACMYVNILTTLNVRVLSVATVNTEWRGRVLWPFHPGGGGGLLPGFETDHSSPSAEA
jgi:hypothetical protein